MANKTSEHILGKSTNLLGFCFFVIASIKVVDKAELTIVDESASIVAVMLIASCLLSFLSIRTQDEKKEEKLESIADMLFISSLVGILLIILAMALSYL